MSQEHAARVGDVIEVPSGTEFPGSAKYRFRVERTSDWGATGIKVRFDGEPLRNRHKETIETGIPWSQWSQVTLHRPQEPS